MMRFPRMHIATSVVNRLLNVADDMAEMGAQAAPGRSHPAPPSPEIQSAVLDEQLSQPVSDALPGIEQAPDPGATAAGDPLLKTLLKPGA